MMRNGWKKKKRFVVLPLTTLTLTALAVVGCSSDTHTGNEEKTNSPTSSAQSQSEQRNKISIMTIYHSPEPAKKDHPVWKEIEKRTNYEMDINFIPGSSYVDKFNVTMATGDLSQAVFVNGSAANSANMVNALDSGAFWEIGPLVKDFPNLAKISQTAMNNVKHSDGKIYGLPRARPLVGGGLLIRRDWLSNLNLKDPTTVEELYQVLKAFTLNDPDKNGKNDTVGLGAWLGEGYPGGLREIAVYLGGPNGGEVKDGKYVRDFMVPQFFEALKLYQRMYNEKLVNQDLGVIQSNNVFENFNKGQYGAFFGTLYYIGNPMFNNLAKLNPNAVMDFVPRIHDRTMGGVGYDGYYAFPKSSVKSEKELRSILTFFDRLSTKEVMDSIEYGVENVHFTYENGMIKKNQSNQYPETDNAFFSPLRVASSLAITSQSSDKPKHLVSRDNAMIENEKYAVFNSAAVTVTQTKTEKGVELEKIITTAAVKFIIGELDEAGWKKAVDQWLQGGGEKILSEITARLNK